MPKFIDHFFKIINPFNIFRETTPQDTAAHDTITLVHKKEKKQKKEKTRKTTFVHKDAFKAFKE
jgi:hypothetical protein